MPSRLQRGVDIAPQFTHSRPSAKSSNKSEGMLKRQCESERSFSLEGKWRYCSGTHKPVGGLSMPPHITAAWMESLLITAPLKIKTWLEIEMVYRAPSNSNVHHISFSLGLSDSQTSDKCNLQPLICQITECLPGTT